MAAAHSSLVRYFHQRLPTTYEPVGKIGSGPLDASQVVRAADGRHWRPNLDSLEKTAQRDLADSARIRGTRDILGNRRASQPLE